MLARLARVTVLALGAIACLASASSKPRQPPPSYSGSSGYPWAQGLAPAGAYSCFHVRGPTSNGSLCFAAADRCEGERAAAARDGAQTTGCAPVAPVSCFQLGGNPSPSMEVCSVSAEDCELWRVIDRDKSGDTGPACEWRHDPNRAAR